MRDRSFRRVLIANPFGIGDVIFTTPLVDTIRASIGPSGLIGYLCNRRTQELLMADPRIHEVFVFEKDEYRALWGESPFKALRAIQRLLEAIRKERYDCVFDLSLNRMFGFCFWWIGIPLRVGYNYKGRGLWLNHRLNLPRGYEQHHLVEYYLDLASSIGLAPVKPKVSLTVAQEAITWVREFLTRHRGDQDRPVVGIAPGGGITWGDKAHYKRWPPERYAAVADFLHDRSQALIVLLGDLGDVPICQVVSRHMARPPILACGQTTVAQLAGLISQCDLVIANDGGPLHLATALGIRTVAIFGPVDERVYGPHQDGDRHQILVKELACHPCYRQFKIPPCPYQLRCLTEISVEEVREAAESQIARLPANQVGGQANRKSQIARLPTNQVGGQANCKSQIANH